VWPTNGHVHNRLKGNMISKAGGRSPLARKSYSREKENQRPAERTAGRRARMHSRPTGIWHSIHDNRNNGFYILSGHPHSGPLGVERVPRSTGPECSLRCLSVVRNNACAHIDIFTKKSKLVATTGNQIFSVRPMPKMWYSSKTWHSSSPYIERCRACLLLAGLARPH